MKLDELIERCNEGVANRLGHHKRLALFADTAAALRMLRDVVEAANGLSHGEDWNKGTHAIRHGYRNKLLTALAALRDAGMIDAAPNPASGKEETKA